MIYKLVVPGPDEEIEEMRVLDWHGGVGHAFRPGELIVELETHKAVVEVRSAQPGVLRSVLCEAGSWQKIGALLAVLSDDPAEPLPESAETMKAWNVAFEIT